MTPAVKELFKSVNICPSDEQTFSAVISWGHTVGMLHSRSFYGGAENAGPDIAGQDNDGQEITMPE